MWEKILGEFAGRDAWRGDLPLGATLPGDLRLDLSRVKSNIHPMFAIRLQVFSDWHRSQGRNIEIVFPENPDARRQLEILGVTEPGSDPGSGGDKVLPITRFEEYLQIEETARTIRELLEDHRPELAHLGAATFMALSELCNNAVEHSASRFPSYVAAAADPNCASNLTIAIADLGIGIPEHLRQVYPEWSDDSSAIAMATFDGVSGTDEPHRGFGFHHVFDKVLKTSLHAAEIEIYSAKDS